MKRHTRWLALLGLLLLTDCQCGRQEPALFTAVETGNPEKVKAALIDGAAVNEKNEYGITALHLAAKAGNKDIARLLIEKGANVNARTIYGCTPLDHAADKEVAELLISKGADVKAVSSFAAMTPLHWAASRGNKEVAEALLTAKADMETRDKYGSTPLHLAASNGAKEVGEVLIEKGAKVNAKDDDLETPLHYAARTGHADMVHLLIAKGADRNAKDKAGKTSEELAYGDATKDAFRFHDILGAIQAGDSEKAETLVEGMTDVNAVGAGGTTLLHVASREGRAKIVEFLLAKEAKVNAVDNKDHTPLDVAKDEAIKAILLKHEGKAGEEIKEEKEKEKADKK
ncbi:MAG: hypothetical protein GXP25_13160 [Planctomycetes bacterium]|nr:hypothetical protein [Planctomycetota bacterium]